MTLEQRDQLEKQMTELADRVVRKTDRFFEQHGPRFDRMRDDYQMYRLEEELPADPRDEEDDEDMLVSNVGYRIFTSNEPRTFADRVISWLTSAILVSRTVHQSNEDRGQRDLDNMWERFIMGGLKSADDRLLRMVQLPVRNQQAFFIAIKGGPFGGRVLIRKKADGSSFFDLTPFDPKHLAYGVGEEGVKWACHKIKRTVDEIEADYEIQVDTAMLEELGEGTLAAGNNEAEREREEITLEVYDYYEGGINMVIASGTSGHQILKPPQFNGSPRTPVVIVPIGNVPLTLDDDANGSYDFSEGVFRANRDMYRQLNLIMSIYLHLVALARNPSKIYQTQTGEKELEEDVDGEGTVIQLAAGENLTLMEQAVMTKDAPAFLGILSGMVQRGSLPHSVFGDLQFQLSGFAIKTLRQGIDAVVQPFFQALEHYYDQVAKMWKDQFVTGFFDPVTVSGKGKNRRYFSETITPEMVAQAGDPIMEIKPVLPEDDAAMIQAAQLARQGDIPLFDDDYIREELLNIQDADLMDDAVKAQLAERAVPTAQLYTLMIASENKGRPDLAKIYLGELIVAYFQQLIGVAQAEQFDVSGQIPPSADTRLKNPSPDVAPQAAVGNGRSAELAQSGPLVPAGTPRPGAQNGAGTDSTSLGPQIPPI